MRGWVHLHDSSGCTDPGPEPWNVDPEMWALKPGTWTLERGT